MRNASYLLLCGLLVTMPLHAQSPCAVNLPVGLVAPDGSLLNGLTSKDVTVELHKKKLPIQQISYDTGARRVLFILDTSRRLPPEIRKTEAALARHILSHPRKSDSFALLTARGAARQVRFEQGNDAVMKAVEELAADPKEHKKAGSLLDALMEGASWFGAPQTGDAILVMSDYLRHGALGGPALDGVNVNGSLYHEGSRYNFRTVSETIAHDRIRVFSVQFGAIELNPATDEPNDKSLLTLSLGSGGSLLETPMQWYGAYKVTRPALKAWSGRSTSFTAPSPSSISSNFRLPCRCTASSGTSNSPATCGTIQERCIPGGLIRAGRARKQERGSSAFQAKRHSGAPVTLPSQRQGQAPKGPRPSG